MNGIEKITGRIEADVQREIEAIAAEADAHAGEIAARYEEQARRESGDILARGRKNAAEREERLASVARLEARKLELTVKQELLGRAFERALEQLLSLPEDEYVALLAKLAAQASSTGREQVLFSQQDRTRYGKQAVTRANEILSETGVGALTLAEGFRPIRGGLILSDGDVEVNCTFETLVRLQRAALEKDVARVLFD